jgi:hypothetical protein
MNIQHLLTGTLTISALSPATPPLIRDGVLERNAMRATSTVHRSGTAENKQHNDSNTTERKNAPQRAPHVAPYLDVISLRFEHPRQQLVRAIVNGLLSFLVGPTAAECLEVPAVDMVRIGAHVVVVPSTGNAVETRPHTIEAIVEGDANRNRLVELDGVRVVSDESRRQTIYQQQARVVLPQGHGNAWVKSVRLFAGTSG